MLPCPSTICRVLCMLFQINLRAVHCLCRMCGCVLLVVFWLIIGTRLRILDEKLLISSKPMRPSQYDLSDPVCDGIGLVGLKSRANAFVLAQTAHSFSLIFFCSSMGWLCRVGVFGLIECSHSRPAFYC